MGGLLRTLSTGRVHGTRYTLTRKAPVERIRKASIGAFEDLVNRELEASLN